MYAFTVRYNNKEKATYEQYGKLFDKWRAQGITITKEIYETCKNGVLHSHGILNMPKNFYRKKLTEKGLHYKLEEIYNIEGWNTYIMKNQYKVPPRLLPLKKNSKVLTGLKPLPIQNYHAGDVHNQLMEKLKGINLFVR
jgi:hypothetical protein